jgi:hypothetical protein
MSQVADTQIDLLTWARELDVERERIKAANAVRAARRGFIVIATDPSVGVDSPAYRRVYATEARTPNQAAAKIRPLVSGRRLHTYLATGKYKHELADARWVA